MTNINDDTRIRSKSPLIPPAILIEELPLTDDASKVVGNARKGAAKIIAGEDDRVLLVVGPCSIHDTKAALEYAKRLREVSEQFRDELLVVMRAYFEKPRTRIGWKGLINDPFLDRTFRVNTGLRLARRFLVDVAAEGLAAGTEFLDLISPQFVADLTAWGAIGARTSQSQVHRELASGLSMPVGFKNGTDGSIELAIDGIRSASQPHHFLSVNKLGLASIFETAGNIDCHMILRGGYGGPNYSISDIARTVDTLKNAELTPSIMVDCSHANSGKNHKQQPAVVREVAQQIAAGNNAITGIMIESFLVEGNQNHQSVNPLVYGQSITDSCMGWEQTLPLFVEIADAVRNRRK